MSVDPNLQSDDPTGSRSMASPAGTVDLPPSLQAIVGLAKAVRSGAPDPQAAQLFDGRLDWIEVIGLADRYRLLPLLIAGIRVHDPDLLEKDELAALGDYLKSHSERCEALLEAHTRTIARLAEVGVPAVTYKGPVLAKVVYGNHQVRDFRDLDVLVPPGDFETAIEEMQRIGFRIDDRMEAECHLVSRAGDYPLVVDLHNRLADIYLPVSADIDRLWDHLQTIDLDGNRFLTFAPEGHLFICCLHLVKEWHNREPFLQYALDAAVLLSDRTPEQWCALLETARDMGVKAYAKLSFSAAACLLGRPFPATWESGREDALRMLCEKLIADLPLLVRVERPPETKFYSAKSLAVRRALASSLRSWLASELRLVRGQLFFIDTHDKEWVPLPAGLHGLYLVLRPIRLTARYIKQHRHSGR